MVGMAHCAVPARAVAGGTHVPATSAFEAVAPLHAARTSQRDVPTTLTRMFHTGFLRMGGTGYQPVLVGNLPARLERAPCRDEEKQLENFDVAVPPGW